MENCRSKIKVLVAMHEFPCATEMLLLLVAKCSDDGANGFLYFPPLAIVVVFYHASRMLQRMPSGHCDFSERAIVSSVTGCLLVRGARIVI